MEYVRLPLPSKEAIEQEHGEEIMWETYLNVIETIKQLVEDQVDTDAFIPEALELVGE